MRNWSIAVLLAAASAVFLMAAKTPVPETLLRKEAPVLEVDVHIVPTASIPNPYELLRPRRDDTFTCNVNVHDEPGSKRVWGTRRLVLAAGQTKEAKSKLGELELTFRVAIARSGDSAKSEVTIARGEKILNRQRATFALPEID